MRIINTILLAIAIGLCTAVGLAVLVEPPSHGVSALDVGPIWPADTDRISALIEARLKVAARAGGAPSRNTPNTTQEEQP